MEQKLKVGILGATGMVGQRFEQPTSGGYHIESIRKHAV